MSQKLDLKRLLAYSAIGNAGYMLLGISSGNLEGLQGILLFAIIYIVMTINAFATILALKQRDSGNTNRSAGSTMGHHSGRTNISSLSTVNAGQSSSTFA